MADPLTAGLIGGGLGLVKTFAHDLPKHNKDQQLNADIIRYSPWTGLKPGPVQQVDPLGGALQGAGTGLVFSSLNKGLQGLAGGAGAGAAGGAGSMLGVDTSMPMMDAPYSVFGAGGLNYGATAAPSIGSWDSMLKRGLSSY